MARVRVRGAHLIAPQLPTIVAVIAWRFLKPLLVVRQVGCRSCEPWERKLKPVSQIISSCRLRSQYPKNAPALRSSHSAQCCEHLADPTYAHLGFLSRTCVRLRVGIIFACQAFRHRVMLPVDLQAQFEVRALCCHRPFQVIHHRESIRGAKYALNQGEAHARRGRGREKVQLPV
jgi:hypothetical protein